MWSGARRKPGEGFPENQGKAEAARKKVREALEKVPSASRHRLERDTGLYGWAFSHALMGLITSGEVLVYSDSRPVVFCLASPSRKPELPPAEPAPKKEPAPAPPARVSKSWPEPKKKKEEDWRSKIDFSKLPLPTYVLGTHVEDDGVFAHKLWASGAEPPSPLSEPPIGTPHGMRVTLEQAMDVWWELARTYPNPPLPPTPWTMYQFMVEWGQKPVDDLPEGVMGEFELANQEEE